MPTFLARPPSAAACCSRDGILFPELIHSQKRDPKTHLHDATAWWSFIAAHPEAVHAMSMVMGDRGIPASYRHMNGYGNHR